MSHWHARAGDRDGNSFEILFHVPIPNTNNRVGVNYRTALVGSGLGGTTRMAEGSAAGQITAVEKASIASGALLEHSQGVTTEPGETAAQLQTRIDAIYAALANTAGPFLVGLARQLDYWGHDRNVP